MPTTEQLRSRLISKLKELFQLDQPDLDFGFYRIMHAKADQVLNFLENDLLKIVEDSFGQASDTRKTELQAAYEKAIEQAKEYGVKDPEESAPVKKAKAALDAVKDTVNAEGEVYDHLYRFFERYYHNGDFISRRYFTRETPGKAAPFAVPYNGEEVKLHWANADQYYIKTAEYFNNFTFDLRKAKEVQDLNKRDLIDIKTDDNTNPMWVHFRIVEAAEGEHGNIKASETAKRYFIIHREKPVELNSQGELVVQFEYRPDPEKTGQENTWRDKRNSEAVKTIFEAMKKTAGAREYQRLLETPAPTDKDSSRTLLSKYINKYTARNTYDYFIHKDLGSFLRRELDFYIKNEVMRLDDIENADAPTVEAYLEKLRVLRKIAGKLIDFLAQLENFQKKLWLKKKFVVETNYCTTLDHVPEELYPEIIANQAQHDEWVKLFAIDEIERDLSNPGYSKTLTVNFLKANNKLVLDTRFFDEAFKTRLIASIGNFDEGCDGLLIHSENFQALNLIEQRQLGQITYIYIDPPFNTNESSFIYKNEYRHSSWGTMVSNSIAAGQRLLSNNGVMSVAIDDLEQPYLAYICDGLFGFDNRLGTLIVEIKPSGRTNDNFFATSHEYLIFYGRNSNEVNICFFELSQEQKAQYSENDGNSPYKWRDFLRTGGFSTPAERPNSFYPIYYNEKTGEASLDEKNGSIKILPVDSEGKFRVWRKTPPSFIKHLSVNEINFTKNREGQWKVQIIDRIKHGTRPKSVWIGKKYDAASHGTKLLKSIFGESSTFSFPKSLHSVSDCIYIIAGDSDVNHTILDFFAGSGTTSHAIIKQNREDGGNRKYILVEMGDYFDTVLKPRIAKIIYSESWKDGKPTARNTGISHCFKYLRLESYEDTLNNLRFDENSARDGAVSTNAGLKEDYMLNYLLDVETRGSQSLLNIDAFTNPEAYQLKIKKPGSDEYTIRNVDLLETFNYLIGLRVTHIAAPQIFNAKFKREADPELPDDQHTRLVIDSRFKQDESGLWWFRKVEGWVPADPNQPNNGKREKVLIVWRKLTGDLEKDNLMLDEWFNKNRISTRDFEFDTIYVNGSNNLPNLKLENENWKVRLIEEDFMRLMWVMESL
ncbi:MAG: site-specific DNA-methyltransferase [Thermodesulfobacteriota bacterium]